MRVIKTLRPGTLGTRRFVARYGKQLLCVRYRLDPASGARFTSVELAIERTRVYGARALKGLSVGGAPPAPLWVKLARNEWLLRRAIKAAGGLWRYPEMVWVVTPEIVKALRLRDRVTRGPPPEAQDDPTPDFPDSYPWIGTVGE